MHDDAVTPEVELMSDRIDASVGGARCRVGQPFVGNQRGDMFEFAGARSGIYAASKVRHEVVGPKAFEDALVPAIGVDQEIAVALKVCGKTPSLRRGGRQSLRSTTRL